MEEEEKILAEISFLPGYKEGMTAEELKATVKGFQTEYGQDPFKMLVFINDKQTSVMISPRNGRSYGYQTAVDNTANDSQCTQAKIKFEDRVAKITAKLGAEPVRNKFSQSSIAGATIEPKTSIETCTWQRGRPLLLSFLTAYHRRNIQEEQSYLLVKIQPLNNEMKPSCIHNTNRYENSQALISQVFSNETIMCRTHKRNE